MQISAIKFSLSLKTDGSYASEICIFLASSSISFNSLLIALCQSITVSIGCSPVNSDTEYGPTFSWDIMLAGESFPSIQEKMTFNKQKM